LRQPPSPARKGRSKETTRGVAKNLNLLRDLKHLTSFLFTNGNVSFQLRGAAGCHCEE
jgi:hypothetical protein